jgi:hypothetical protein
MVLPFALFVLLAQVPHFAAFLFLSIFPQLPLALCIAFVSWPITSLDRIVGLILFAFLLAELALGFRTVRVIIQHQTARFMLEPSDDDPSFALVGDAARLSSAGAAKPAGEALTRRRTGTGEVAQAWSAPASSVEMTNLGKTE